jgi:hypothetical protein
MSRDWEQFREDHGIDWQDVGEPCPASGYKNYSLPEQDDEQQHAVDYANWLDLLEQENERAQDKRNDRITIPEERGRG